MDVTFNALCQRVLLLENDEAGGFRIRDQLVSTGLAREVSCIVSLEMLQRELENRPPDMIVAEYPLRCIDGLAVLRFRNRYASGLPLIFVSDLSCDNDVIEAMCLGCSDLVFWIHLSELPAMVRCVLAEVELHRALSPLDETGSVMDEEFDAETGLPGHDRFMAQLDARCRGHAMLHGMVLLVIELGAVEMVGESEGSGLHAAGVLEHTVERLSKWLDVDDLVARIGAFRFAIVLGGEDARASAWVPLLLERLRDPILIAGQFWSLPVYSGLARYPEDGADAVALMHSAEYELRSSERDAVCRHRVCHGPRTETQQRQQVEDELRAALEPDGGLQLLYQPQAELAGGRIIGLEAVLCWHHPRLGILKAGDFVPLAEFCGLMPLLDCWVLNQGCLQLRKWREAGVQAPCLSLNLSPGLFFAGTLIGDLEGVLHLHGIEAGALELGLSEAATMRDPKFCVDTMLRLRALGLKLSFKDFGSGYSSLVSLKRFPLTRLKLDRSFVQGIADDPGDLAIVRALIALAHELCLDVVADEVETREQMILLIEAKCEALQGYLFSPPVSAEACRSMLLGGFVLQID
ncbi:two-component system response regulator [Paludibacterium yongneupense]|uniref:two-component system response regulator n=1 Tax=Paludibacterium yongneupense TaxID=400061 RepID=UPI00040B9D2D|nr:EAL domain-containing protein [Paludibacterium yongneupense]